MWHFLAMTFDKIYFQSTLDQNLILICFWSYVGYATFVKKMLISPLPSVDAGSATALHWLLMLYAANSFILNNLSYLRKVALSDVEVCLLFATGASKFWFEPVLGVIQLVKLYCTDGTHYFKSICQNNIWALLASHSSLTKPCQNMIHG